MLAQIPRKPIFPQHIVASLIARIEKDVNDDVIPVSAGIYSQYKLNQKLQAIPKPTVVDYNDPIFFDLADYEKMPCRAEKCSNCRQDYGNKKNVPAQCKFCGVWLCSECICQRKRYHPRAREISTPRYQICYKCDDKFLSLTLHHGYVESRSLLEEAIQRVKEQKNSIEKQCDKREQDSTVTKQTVAKNKFKISSMKKEKIDLNKTITNIKREKQELLFKLQIRQKYITQLKQKQLEIQQNKRKKIEEETEVTCNEEFPVKEIKVRRALTQKNVLSEAIYQQKIDKQSLQPQEQKQSSPKLQSVKITTQQIQQIKLPTEENEMNAESMQIVKNFFNFHEWGREEQKREGQVSSKEQQNFRKSYEEQTKIDVNFPSPKYNLLAVETQTQNVKQSFARTRLAEIFKKQEKTQIQLEQEELSQPESLDAEVIETRRRDIMKAAIQQSQFQRLSLEQNEIPQTSVGQKCVCDIY